MYVAHCVTIVSHFWFSKFSNGVGSNFADTLEFIVVCANLYLDPHWDGVTTFGTAIICYYSFFTPDKLTYMYSL